MSENVWAEPNMDDLLDDADAEAAGAFNSIPHVIEMQADELDGKLPYMQAQADYEQHLETCETCQTEPIWSDVCTEGARLSGRAADAIGSMTLLAAQN